MIESREPFAGQYTCPKCGRALVTEPDHLGRRRHADDETPCCTDLSDYSEQPAQPTEDMAHRIVVELISARIRLQSVALQRAALRYKGDQQSALQAVARKLSRAEVTLRAIVSPHPMRVIK